MDSNELVPKPTTRTLRIYAVDPSISAQYEAVGTGEITIDIPWESDLRPGPVGDYVEVVDADPASDCFYKPVDLNSPHILAQDGIAPSETNPQFHQQMVYAVTMATIRNFERALGRVAFWSNRRSRDDEGEYITEFVKRLRLYPHGLRDRNAYYSPPSKAVLFGYFPVELKDAHNVPGTLVFTCLSHDIIAHEVTHALLDGVHPRFNEPVNEDVFAFHEAFADIVALFQHFSYPGVLREQIAKTRGNLATENRLAQLAQQFGRAAGRGGALRDALGTVDAETGKWQPRDPNVHALQDTFEAHDRGGILVAAVFGAFLKVYRARTLDLYRIATEGTGVLREGDIHPDLSARLADEAAYCAQRILQMCIRAIDYCPPVSITFGDYLRAVVTADYDLDPDDTFSFRIAFIESFRQWGIQPAGVRSMSTAALLWPSLDDVGIAPILQRALGAASLDVANGKTGNRGSQSELYSWDLESDRYQTWQNQERKRYQLWRWLNFGEGRKWSERIGIVLGDKAPPTVFRNAKGQVTAEVHSVRTTQRRTQRGSIVSDLVVEIVQRRRGYLDEAVQTQKDRMDPMKFAKDDDGDFKYRAGCTLIINAATLTIRRIIKTPGTIVDDRQLARQRAFMTGGRLQEGANAFDSPKELLNNREPFAMLHAEGE